MSKSCIKKNKLNNVCYIFVLLIYFVSLSYLIYNQLTNYGSGKFESDTLAHFELATIDHYYYSLSSFIYVLLNFLGGYEYSVSALLAGINVGSVILAKVLLEKLFENAEINVQDSLINILSLILNFVNGFYISIVNKRHYIGYQSGNMWHNSTYIFMRFFAIITLIFYLKICEKYKNTFRLKEWFLLTFLLIITTGFKPSFLTVFAPFLLIKLLYDLIKGTRFANVFIMGTTVLPAIGIMFLESSVLFPGGGNSGYAIAPFAGLSLRGDHPKVSLVLSILFPLTVLLFNIKNIKHDKIYLGSLIMWLIGFLEVFLLIETGDRAKDGNFFWGYSIAIFFWFIVSAVRAYKSYVESDSRIKHIIVGVEGAVLVWHFISGIWYYILLLQGFTYFV